MENIFTSRASKITIGLLSDTHLLRVNELPVQIWEVFKDVDLILHAGDIYDLSILDELEHIAPVLAARGDEDLFQIPDKRVKEAHLLTIGGLTLWLQHRMPWGLLQLLNSGLETEVVRRVSENCENIPDITVFGDTHSALLKHSGGILFINPGSPTLPHYINKNGTLAILKIIHGKAEGNLVQLD